jgi:hypothetical protein
MNRSTKEHVFVVEQVMGSGYRITLSICKLF